MTATVTPQPAVPDDPMWRIVDRALVGVERLSYRSGRRRRPARAVDRSLRLVVEQVRIEATDVLSLRQVAPDRSELPASQPGCHIDLLLPSGKLRQYSLCGDPRDRHHYRIAVRRIADGGGGSREVHEALQPGSSVVVRGPRNAFPFIVADKYYFLAGGIGITPILPMIRDAARRSADWQFVYTGRSRTTMPFLDELAAFDQSRILIRPDDEYGGPDLSRIMDEAPLGAAA